MRSFYFALCVAVVFNAKRSFGSEAGMPQLNPEFWIAQIFWLLIVFVSLYLIVWKIFLPRITYSIENRKSRIVNDLDEAEKLKESAEKKLKEYNLIIEHSKKEAKKIIEDSKKRLNQDLESKKEKFNSEIEKEIRVAEEEIEKLKKSSISNISSIATETSTEVIKQIINTEVNKSSVSAIVNEIVKRKMEKYL
jgi:F-type H+-transporting ATPase subunit b